MRILARNYELIKNVDSTFLTAAVSATGTTLTVKAVDSNAWANGDYIIIGNIGTKTSEIVAINAAVSDGTSLTVTAVRFAHSIDEPVYRIAFNQVEFSRAATATGSKTVLATNELQTDDEYTRYEDTTNTTGYGFVRFKNSTTGGFSQYSDAVPYTGYPAKSLGKMIGMVRKRLNNPRIQDVSDEDIIEEINEKQRDIAHERLWSFYESIFSTSRVAYQRDYDIDDSAVYGKVHAVVVDSEPLAKVDAVKFDMLHWDSTTTGEPTRFHIWNNKIRLYPLPSSAASSTTLNGTITATATSLILTDASAFRAPGRLLIDSEVISYEYIDSSTETLYGLTRGLEGTTAAAHTTAGTVTERDIIYTAHTEPTDLVNYTDETQIPDPDVLINGASMELALGKLSDGTLHDRLEAKYDKGISRLRDKFGKKGTAFAYHIKDKNEIVSDNGSMVDPNRYPTNITD